MEASPQRAGYAREVSSLRAEVNVLRRRAEEAMEQKWQLEKGLIGLKMDLDRTEEEIAMLRSVLQENDVYVPSSATRGSFTNMALPIATSSLEKAYRELQD